MKQIGMALVLCLLVFSMTACTPAESPDAQFYALGYTRALAEGSQEETLRLGNVDANAQAAARAALAARVGTDIKDYLVEGDSFANGTTVVTIRLISRDGREATVRASVVDGTGKITDVEVE